jgi:hypothetical protein
VSDIHLVPLWELAENRGERVWLRFLEEAVKTPQTTKQLLAHSQVLLHAAVGLDSAKRNHVEQFLVGCLRDPAYADRRADLALILVNLGGLQHETIPLVSETLLQALNQTRDRKDVCALCEGLRSLSVRMDTHARTDLCQKAVERLVQLLVETKESGYRVDLLVVFGTVATQLDPAAAARAAEQLLVLLSETENARMGDILVLNLTDIADRLDPNTSFTLHHKAAVQLLRLIPMALDYAEINLLAERLTKVMDRLDPAMACSLCQKAAEQFLASLIAAKDDDQVVFRSRHLRAVAVRLDPTIAARMAERLLLLLTEAKRWLQAEAYANSLSKVAVWLDPLVAAEVAERLLRLLAAPSGPKICHLADCLSVVTARLDPATADKLCGEAAEQLLASLAEAKEDEVWYLTESLTKIASRLAPTTAGRTAERLLLLLKKTQSLSQARYLADSLAVIVVRLDPVRASGLCQETTEEILRLLPDTKDLRDVSLLASNLTKMASWLDPATAARAAESLLTLSMMMPEDTLEFRYLVEALDAVAVRLDAAAAARLTARIIPHLEETRGGYDSLRMARTLTVLTLHLAPDQRALLFLLAANTFTGPRHTIYGMTERDFPRVLGFIPPSELLRRVALLIFSCPISNGYHLTQAPWVLVVMKPPPCPLSTATLVELLQRPIVVGTARRVILDALGNRYHRHFRDQWDFVRFAQEQRLDLDFTAGPKRRLTGMPEPRMK